MCTWCLWKLAIARVVLTMKHGGTGFNHGGLHNQKCQANMMSRFMGHPVSRNIPSIQHEKICFLLNQVLVYPKISLDLDNPMSIIHHYSMVSQIQCLAFPHKFACWCNSRSRPNPMHDPYLVIWCFPKYSIPMRVSETKKVHHHRNPNR